MNASIVLLLFVIISLLAGIIGAQFEPGFWYEMARKPAWTPPDWLFAPVWTALYILMGVAAWLAWRPSGWRWAHSLFIGQLILNAAWSWIFFGLHRTGWAMAEMALLALLVLLTTIGFWRLRPLAGALMLPYLLWLVFAWALNFSIWRMNGGAL